MPSNIVSDFEGVIRLDTTAYGLEQRRDIKSMLKYIPRGAAVLDVGCGFGLPTSQASEYFAMSACDIDSRGQPDFIEQLMKLRNIDFKWSQSGNLPFGDHMFDALLLYAVIEHVPDKVALLNACRRVLKPSGKIFIFRAVNQHSIAERIVRRLGYATHGNDVVTKSSLIQAAEASGFDVDRIGYQGWLPENMLPRTLVFSLNQLLVRIPWVNRFSHDFFLVATRRT